jgi:hypothetical protein
MVDSNPQSSILLVNRQFKSKITNPQSPILWSLVPGPCVQFLRNYPKFTPHETKHAMTEDIGMDKLPQDEPVPGFDVPVKGSLGLLALGDLGLKAWRRARRDASDSINAFDDATDDE